MFFMTIFSARGRARGAAPPSVNLGFPSYPRNYQSQKVETLHTFRRGQVPFSSMKMFPLGGVRGRSAPSENLGPLISRKLLELESRNFTHISMGPSTLFGYEDFSAMGVRGAQHPWCKLGTPHISKSARARNLIFNTHLDGASTHFGYEILFRQGASGGVAPSIKLGPLKSRKLLDLESLSSIHMQMGLSTLFRYEHFSARACGDAAPLL